MAVPFRGKNLTGNALSPSYNLPFRIQFFTVANKNAGSNTVNISIVNDADEIRIVPNNLLLSEGDMLQGDYNQVMDAGNQIKINTSAEVDYYFTIENIYPS